MISELIETRNLSVLYPLLQEFGGWPILGDTPGGMWNDSNFDLTDLLISLLKYNNMPLLPLWVGLDDKNNTIRTIFVSYLIFGRTLLIKLFSGILNLALFVLIPLHNAAYMATHPCYDGVVIPVEFINLSHDT